MIIALDFDGTCVSHEFPHVGNDIGAVPVIRELVDAGHQLILFTMRSDSEDPSYPPVLQHALEWFKENQIPLFGIQKNPTQERWTSSPKAYAQLYIDDAALGCPLRTDLSISVRPFVDWERVREMLVNKGLIKE